MFPITTDRLSLFKIADYWSCRLTNCPAIRLISSSVLIDPPLQISRWNRGRPPTDPLWDRPGVRVQPCSGVHGIPMFPSADNQTKCRALKVPLSIDPIRFCMDRRAGQFFKPLVIGD
jgi:hypothetical protein